MPVCGPLCKGCPLEPESDFFIPHSGSGSNGVLILGDSGGFWDTLASAERFPDPLHYPTKKIGTPFSGPSRWFIEENLSYLGVKADDFTFANIISCKPPHPAMFESLEKYPDARISLKRCKGYLERLIEERKPKVIIPMGEVALFHTTGYFGTEKHHGYILPTPYGIPAIPTFHPAYITDLTKSYQNLRGCWLFVVKKALDIASGKEKPIREYELLRDPPLDDAIAYFSVNQESLVCDIETAESPSTEEDDASTDISWRIIRISFSNRLGSAISMPFAPPYLPLIKSVLAEARHLIFWNQAFDVPRLRAAGCYIKAVINDAMWAWHFLQSDLPKALGFAAPLLLNIAPWKHLSGSMPSYYSALDSAITADCWKKIQEALAKEGRLEAFERQCTDLLPVLQGMTDAGLLLDVEKQTKFLDVDLVKERDALYAKIQDAVPLAAKPVKSYKKYPPKKLKPFEVYADVYGGGGVLHLPFNPSSSAQRKVLFRHFGIPIPYDSRKKKESIERKHLRRYGKKFPVLKDIEEYGERQKLITSYDWQLEPDGRIHPEYGFNPSTWRKNARNPNIQTIPKRNDLAKRFRELFIAAPGCVLIELDSSAIEAVLVGYFADSPEYITLAKKGVHKWLAEQYAGRPVSKDEPLYDKIKRIVHMSNYMGSPKRIAEEYPDDFATAAEASKLQDFYFSTPAGKAVRAWQSDTIAAANHDHHLDTPFGQRHYFYDVLGKKDGEVVLRSDAKRAVAFKPQATASALQTLYIQRLPEKYREYLTNGQYFIPTLRAIIHDSLVFEVDEKHKLELAEAAFKAMTGPVAELGGLSIGAECKIGKNLGEMKTVELKGE